MKKYILIAISVTMMFLLSACGTIASGETGVKKVDGIVQDQVMEEGRYGVTGSRTEIIRVNNKRQSFSYNEKISGESKDKTVVYAEGVNITYQISKDASVWMVKNMGDNFQDNIIPSIKIASAIKNAMANIDTEKCTNRSYIEPAAKQEIQEVLDEYYYPDAVKVIDVSISQMDYENSYNEQISKISSLKKQAEADAISNNIKIEAARADAEADATRAEAKKKIAEANAEVALIEAQSYAETKSIEAKADADKIKAIGNALNDNYIDYQKIEKWDGALPTHTNGEAYFSIDEE